MLLIKRVAAVRRLVDRGSAKPAHPGRRPAHCCHQAQVSKYLTVWNANTLRKTTGRANPDHQISDANQVTDAPKAHKPADSGVVVGIAARRCGLSGDSSEMSYTLHRGARYGIGSLHTFGELVMKLASPLPQSSVVCWRLKQHRRTVGAGLFAIDYEAVTLSVVRPCASAVPINALAIGDF